MHNKVTTAGNGSSNSNTRALSSSTEVCASDTLSCTEPVNKQESLVAWLKLIRDRRALQPHAFGDLLLLQGESLHQRLIAARLLEGVQVLPLDVLHDRELEAHVIGDVVTNDGRIPVGEPGTISGTAIALIL